MRRVSRVRRSGGQSSRAQRERASSIIEYLIILAFMGLSAISVISSFGDTLKQKMIDSGEIIQGAGGFCEGWHCPPE